MKVSPNGLVSRYEDAGFHAIGSGASMAQQAAALLGHFQMTDRNITYGAIAMVRVIDALRVSQPMVGGPINLASLTADGARFADEDEIEEYRERVAQWEEAEQKALDSLLDA